VIGHDTDTGALVNWVLDSLSEYLKYHDDADDRAAIHRAATDLPLIVLP
jgi:hypothetical protein